MTVGEYRSSLLDQKKLVNFSFSRKIENVYVFVVCTLRSHEEMSSCLSILEKLLVREFVVYVEN